jgi:predicted anti-sigma-YlaC factor YlaD
MPMRSCYNLRKYLSDYLENKLEPELQAKVEFHLQSCPECKRSVENLKLLQKQLSKLRKHQCSQDFTQKLHQRIQAPQPSFSLHVPLRRFSYAFGIVLIVFLSVYTMQWFYSQPKEDVITPSSIIEPAGQEEVPIINTGSQQDVEIKTKESLANQDDSSKTRKNSDDRIKHVDGNK